MPNGAQTNETELKTAKEISDLMDKLSENIKELEKEIEKQFDIFKESSDVEYNQLKEHFDGFFTELEVMWSNSATTTGPLKNPQGAQKLDFFIRKICNPKENDKITGIFNNAREKLNTAECEILNFWLSYKESINELLYKFSDEFKSKIKSKINGDKKLSETEIKIDKVKEPIKFGEIASKCEHELIEDRKTNIVNALSEEVGRDRIIDQLRRKKVIKG